MLTTRSGLFMLVFAMPIRVFSAVPPKGLRRVRLGYGSSIRRNGRIRH
jgi:hypothetical protein